MVETTLPIGTIARRTGLAVSAIRYYEERGLITSERNRGGQRRFLRSDIRRLSFILISQELGFSLEEIKDQIDRLPNGRTPTAKDWEKLSTNFRDILNARIARLEQLRDTLSSCIGCGCLSLDTCKLYNKDDKAARKGSGPRYLMGDKSSEIE